MKPLLAVGLCVLAIGCNQSSGDGRPRILVSGTVTLDGAPVEGAEITYTPEMGQPGQGGIGASGPDGKYTIKNPYETEPGMIASTYRVTVFKAGRTAPKKTEQDEIIDAHLRGNGSGLPAQYADPEKTPLRITVESGGKPADLVLSSNKNKK